MNSKPGPTMTTLCTRLFWAALTAVSFTAPPLIATEMDDRIEAAFRNSYASKVYLKDDAIRSECRNGIVTLSGTVSESSHKTLAEEAAAGLPGVHSVENRLSVQLEGTEKSDTWIRAKVRSILSLHRKVSGTGTQVDIRDGVITLRGVASSEAQRDLATEYASDVQGVLRVTNVMTLANPLAQPAAPAEPDVVDDASITAQVKVALQLHHSTSSITTRVTTLAGVVTIEGHARNPAEKVLVTKLAADIPGVRKVVNNMLFRPPGAATGTPPRPVLNLRVVSTEE